MRTSRKDIRNGLEPEEQALKTLQQRVVQFPRDACALVDPHLQGPIELMSKLTHTELIGNEEKAQEGNDAQHAKRDSLVERRGDVPFQHCAFFVPDATVVGSNNAEPISAWAKVGVVRMTRINRHSPIRVLALQFHTNLNLFRRDETQHRIVDSQIFYVRR